MFSVILFPSNLNLFIFNATNSTFTKNECKSMGGVLKTYFIGNYDTEFMYFINCTFSYNKAKIGAVG